MKQLKLKLTKEKIALLKEIGHISEPIGKEQPMRKATSYKGKCIHGVSIFDSKGNLARCEQCQEKAISAMKSKKGVKKR